MPVTIYGASDDLIELDGDIYEEFSHYSEDPALLAFSDGTILKVLHDQEGIWRITPIQSGSASLTHTFGQDDKQHSDKVVLEGDVRWVVYGSEMATRR